MALVRLPGGVIYDDVTGARINEPQGINFEAIHRQLGAQTAAALDEARRLRYAVTRDHTIILDVDGAPNVSVDNFKYTFQIGD